MANERWTYQVVEIKPTWTGSLNRQVIQERLNQLGMQGWELVSTSQSHFAAPVHLFLKKAL